MMKIKTKMQYLLTPTKNENKKKWSKMKTTDNTECEWR